MEKLYHPRTPHRPAVEREVSGMAAFLLWCLLLVVCWPLALLALILYPIVWILLLPFRLIGITLTAVFDMLGAILSLPARILRGPGHLRA
jgi:hypothetical protein